MDILPDLFDHPDMESEGTEAADTRARYVMVGGFLGAGKTTAIQAFAQHLTDAGQRVGLITNDQGVGLADSAIGRSNHFPVEEIGGGCFCCRFNSLIDAARNLTAESRPDVLLAEPVGSCTDLVATVALPLQKIYGADYSIAPFCVLIDPVRALRVLELEEGKRFSPNVRYIYRKQLEEADAIVINKLDLLEAEPQRLEVLRAGLAEQFPGKRVFEISARAGDGMAEWFDWTLAETDHSGSPLEIDYNRYGEGEALLGWLNATLHLEPSGDGEFDGNQLLRDFASSLRQTMTDAGSEVAHLKMTLTPKHDAFELGAINLVRDDAEPELSHRLIEPLDDGELLLNIRAEAAPETLEAALQKALSSTLEKQYALTVVIPHLEHFRPGMPNPTHRLN